MAPASCDSIGFDTDSCCQQGSLTYPTAQLRAPAGDGSSQHVVTGFGVPVVQLPLQAHRERRASLSANSPPTPLYTLNATFRI
jgi:hypothetical protein